MYFTAEFCRSAVAEKIVFVIVFASYHNYSNLMNAVLCVIWLQDSGYSGQAAEQIHLTRTVNVLERTRSIFEFSTTTAVKYSFRYFAKFYFSIHNLLYTVLHYLSEVNIVRFTKLH